MGWSKKLELFYPRSKKKTRVFRRSIAKRNSSFPQKNSSFFGRCGHKNSVFLADFAEKTQFSWMNRPKKLECDGDFFVESPPIGGRRHCRAEVAAGASTGASEMPQRDSSCIIAHLRSILSCRKSCAAGQKSAEGSRGMDEASNREQGLGK